MTLIIRLISSKRTIHFADGNKTVQSKIVSTNVKKILLRKNLLLSFAGTLDDDNADMSFNILQRMEAIPFEEFENYILIRDLIFTEIEDEYNKAKSNHAKKLLIFTTFKNGKNTINETLCYDHGYYKKIKKIKCGVTIFKDLDYLFDEFPEANFSEKFKLEFKEAGRINNEICVDFNHNYYPIYNRGMPQNLRIIIPSLLFASYFEVTKEFPTPNNVFNLSEEEIKLIGKGFFDKFNAIKRVPQIGDFEMFGSL